MPSKFELFSLLFCFFSFHDIVVCNKTRQHYGGRVLNIAPKQCTSSKYPGVTGTCMISLECQQRSGTVIGACRDGVLFGACCHDAAETSTTIKPEETTLATTTFSPSTTLIPQITSSIHTTVSETISTKILEKSTTHFTTTSTTTTTTAKPSKEPSTLTTLFVKPTTSEKLTTSTTVKETTTPSSLTTKFVYGKINYSPRPFKLRPTTKKTVWTRPPTTEASYSVIPSSSDEQEEDEEEKVVDVSNAGLKFTEPQTTIFVGSISNSVETSTVPLPQTTISEEVVTSPIAEQSSSQPIATTPTTTSTTTTTTETLPNNYEETFTTLQEELINSSMPTNASPVKLLRLSTDMEEDHADGWENKLDEFVNQVVDGIAEKLDNSNIDEVVFKPSTTEKSTTTRVTKKPKASQKNHKPNKNKISGIQTHKKQKTPPTKIPMVEKRKKNKPKKKVPSSEEFTETEHDVLDYREVCGVRPLARQSRIVGGNPSTHGTWPWHALVKETVWWGIFSKIKCGGVLIGPKHVVTAAHCQPQQTGTLSVVFGVTDSDNPSTHAITKGVRRVIRHPQFNPRSYENDIAILELDSPVPFQPHIVPICLPDHKEKFVGKKGFVTGMGLLKHDGERPSILMEVDVPILNNTDCEKMFRKSGNMKPIKPSFICAGYRHGRKDSCGGDSGGPLSVQRSNGQWVLAGTVSHGIKCAVPNQPGIYMRTTWYLPWINKVISSARADMPKCHGPPPVCEPQQARSGGLMDTIFRIFRMARRLWKLRK